MEIEVSAFSNFSTDTGSTDCNQVNINMFRFRRSQPSVPHGTNFIFIKIKNFFLNLNLKHIFLAYSQSVMVCSVSALLVGYNGSSGF